MVIYNYENKYVPTKNKHLIVIHYLNKSLYNISEVSHEYENNTLTIKYKNREATLNSIDIKSSNIMICEVDEDGNPSRIYDI